MFVVGLWSDCVCVVVFVVGWVVLCCAVSDVRDCCFVVLCVVSVY